MERDVREVMEYIKPGLQLVEEKLRNGADTMFPPLADGLKSLLDSGGKRLRPALVLLSSRFHQPGAPLEKVISLAAAVETLHTATLVHDDLIDGASVRRGHKTLSATWNKASTVLAGDYLFARAAMFAAETENSRVVSIFSQALMTICEGELRQLFGAFHFEQDLEEYYLRIYSKTASLFAASTEASAVLSGADEETIRIMRTYGRNLGMSFQIQDDMLDFIGDQKVMGKPTGNDLRQGIVTLPVYFYLRGHPGRETWVKSFGVGGPAREATIQQLVAEIARSSAIVECQARSEEFALEAQNAISSLPDNAEKHCLGLLVSSLLDRKQ